MPETDDATTARAEAIASQVVDLEETEVLVLRLPEDMHTGDQVFEQFRRELRRLLPEHLTTPTRAIVLAHNMELETFDAEKLARVGLAIRAKQPGKEPEELFESGPLRAAAQAAWASAFGDPELAERLRHNAEEALRVEVETKGKLNITHSTPPERPRQRGGPF
jgi:hypothetical protein